MTDTTPAPEAAEPTAAEPTVAEIAEQKQVRLDKRERMLAAGIDAYPVGLPVTDTIPAVRERHPDLDTGHPRMAIAELERRDVDPVIVRAIASHADFLGVSRDSPMEKTLYAVDELSGFVLACAYVRPAGLAGLTPKSVRKKLKQPSFAAAVNRDDVIGGAAELGVDPGPRDRSAAAAPGA